MLLERCSYCAMVCASINFSSVLWRPRTQVPLSGGRWCYVFFFFLACDNSLVHLTSINISLRPQEEPLLIRHNICLFYFVLLISLISRKKHVLLTRTGVHCLVYHAQVVGGRIKPSGAHAVKATKYMHQELCALVSRDVPPIVSKITLSYRGIWAKESLDTLRDLGFSANDFNLLTIPCLQGSWRCFTVH